MGHVGPHVTAAIRGQPSLKTEPIRPFLGSLTNFATGPVLEPVVARYRTTMKRRYFRADAALA